MTDKFKDEMQEAAYKSMLKVNPGVILRLKEMLKSGVKAKRIAIFVSEMHGNNSLTANSTILSAYYMEDHPETLVDN
jgi:hypothetical protein